MKTIYIVRHAKSSWKDMSLDDRDRPLNKRGKRDAPIMADYVQQRIEVPDEFISSPSLRTVKTSEAFMAAFDVPSGSLTLEEDLFHGDEEDFERVVLDLAEEINKVMLFGHNPWVTNVVNGLIDPEIFDVPTCGVIGLSFDTNTWQNCFNSPCHLLFYYYPKGLDLPHSED